jgi:type VI protein secretion system component Hcp
MQHPPLRRSSVRIITGLSILLLSAAAVAGDIILSIPGLTGGGAGEPGYIGDIDLLSYNQTFARTAAGNGTSCGTIAITKYLDGTSTKFLYAAVTGLTAPTATIYFPGTSLNGTSAAPYTITLTNVTVTSISQGDSVTSAVASNSNIGLVETILLTAQKFQFTYQLETAIGQNLGPPATIGFDCTQQRTF